MSSAADVIGRFGGQSALARAIGANQSTVQHWARTGEIPAWRHEQILHAAHERGIALGRTDFGGASSGGGQTTQSGQPVQGAPGAGLPRGRLDPLPGPEQELGALRDEIAQLRAVVAQLVEEVAHLRKERARPQPNEGTESERG